MGEHLSEARLGGLAIEVDAHDEYCRTAPLALHGRDQILVDRPQVDSYELPLGEPGAHHVAGDERVGRDDGLRRGEVVAVQYIGRQDTSLGVDEVPAEEDEVLGDEGVDEGFVVNVELTEHRALQQSDEDVHILIMPSQLARHDPHINHYRGGRYTMNAPASIAITPVCVADLLAEDERMPVYVHVIDHPDARVLVDTGMTELHPAMADMDPRLQPLSEQDFDLAGIDIVVNTHLHADHCGGNHLFAGKPIYVQRRELDDARSEDDYTIREWVEAPGVRYMPVDGEHELLPGLRLVPAPGHTPGMQMVVVETGGRPVVVGGDVAVWFGELDEPHTEGQLRVRALNPELVWLAHEHEPWRPRTV